MRQDVWPEEELRPPPVQRALLPAIKTEHSALQRRLGPSPVFDAVREAAQVRAAFMPAPVPQRPLPALPRDHLHRSDLRVWQDIHPAAAPLRHPTPIMPPLMLGPPSVWALGLTHLPFWGLPPMLGPCGKGMHWRARAAEEHPMWFQGYPV